MRGLLVSLLILGAVVGMLWAFQRQLIYYPDATPPPPADEVIPGSRAITLHTRDGLELDAWFVPAADRKDTRMAVLLAPGNGGNRADRAELAERLSERGLAVLEIPEGGDVDKRILQVLANTAAGKADQIVTVSRDIWGVEVVEARFRARDYVQRIFGDRDVTISGRFS